MRGPQPIVSGAQPGNLHIVLLRLADGRRLRPRIPVFSANGQQLYELHDYEAIDGLRDGTYRAVGSKRSVTGAILPEEDQRELKGDRVPIGRPTSYRETVADGCKTWKHAPSARFWKSTAVIEAIVEAAPTPGCYLDRDLDQEAARMGVLVRGAT